MSNIAIVMVAMLFMVAILALFLGYILAYLQKINKDITFIVAFLKEAIKFSKSKQGKS